MKATEKRYQLSRFLALMNQHQREVEALTTSIQSQGSAMRENEKFQDSMISKINKMKTSLDEMALSLGKAFLNDTFVSLVQGLGSIAKGVSNLVDVFGGLPVITTAAYTGFLLFGGEARKYVTTMKGVNIVTDKFKKIQGETVALFSMMKGDIATETAGMTGMARATKGATVAVRTLGIAFKEALIASGVGIAIVAITFGIEKIIESTNKQRQEAKRLKEQETQLVTTYKSHADEIKNLADQYRQMSLEVEAGTRTKNDKEYLDTQQQISKLLPNVVESVNAVGQAHLKSANAVDKEVESLRKLSTLNSQKFVEDFSDKLDKLNQKIIDTSSHIKKSNFEVTGNPSAFNQGGTNPIEFKPTPLTTEDQMNNIINEQELQAQIKNRVDLFKQLSTEYQSFLGVQDTLTKSDNDYINSIIDKNKANLNDVNTQKKVETQIKSTIGSLGELRSAFGDNVDLSSILNVVSPEQLAGLSSLVKGFKSGGESVEQFTAIMKFNGYTMDQIIPIVNALSDAQAENANKTKEQIDAQAAAQQTLQSILNGTKDVQEVLNDAVSSSIGLSKDQIDENQKLIEVYGALSNATNLTDEQQELLKQTYDELVKRFPELANGHKLNINTLMDEANANSVLYQATIDSANGRLTAEQELTLKLAQEAKNQIDILKKQVAAHRAAAMDMIGIDQQTGKITNDNGMLRLSNIALQNLHASEQAQSELDNIAIPNFIKTGKVLAQKLGYDIPFKTPEWSSNSGKKSKGSSGGSKSVDKKQIEIVDKYANALTNLKAKIDLNEKQLSQLDQTSEKYRQALAKRIKLLQQEQGLMHKSADQLREERKNTKLSADQKQQLTEKINSLSAAWWDVKDAMDSIRYDIIQSKLQSFTNAVDELNHSLSISKSRLNTLTEGTQAYDSELMNQLSLLRQQQSLQKQQADYIRQQLASGSLSSEQTDELNKQLNQLGESWWDLQSQIVSLQNSMIDEIINAYKAYYEQKKQLDEQAVQDEMDALEKSHQDKMDMLDEEYNAYQKIIQAKLDSIDKQENQNDYNKQLGDLNQQKADLQSQIDVLSLDNSYEAKAKREELQKQLADKINQINDLQHKHEVDLRKQNLQDDLDAKKQEVDAEKKKNDDEYQSQKDMLDKKKQDIENYYNNLINDDRKWAQMRQDILSGNLNNMSGQLKSFAEFIQSHMAAIGVSISQNLIDKLMEANQLLSQVGQVGGLKQVGTSTDSSNSSSSNSYAKDLPKGYNVDNQLEYLRKVKSGNPSSSGKYKWANDQLYYWDLFLNGTSGQHDWAKSRIQFHDGGIVGGATTKFADMVNKLFNTKPNEQIIKALKGELFTTPQNIVNNFIPNMQNILSSSRPVMTGDNINIDIHDITVQGGIKGANELFKEIGRQFTSQTGRRW